MCLISIFFCIFAPCDWINRVFIAEKITEIPTGSCLTSAAVSANDCIGVTKLFDCVGKQHRSFLCTFAAA